MAPMKHAAAALALVVAGNAGAAAAIAAALPSALQRPALKAAHPARANLQAIERVGSRLVAAGERGLIIYSDDGGLQWKQAEVPASVTLTALRFANGRDGWAVGNMGVVLKTADGGATWRRVFDGRAAATLALQAAQQAHAAARPNPDDAEHPANRLLDDARRLVEEGADKPLLAIALGENGSVMVAGAYGLAFSTLDGGRSWRAHMQELPNPEGATYYGIARRGQERYLFGEQGLVLRASAPGAAFAAEASPAAGSLFGGLTLKDDALLVFGLRGKVYRSAAAGAPWTEVQTPVDASLISGLQLPDDTVLLLGAAGQVVASRDGGQAFSVLPMKERFPFTGAAVAPDGSLVLVGTRGLLRMALPGRAAAPRIQASVHSPVKP